MTYEELTYRRNDSVEGDVYVKKYELFQVFASMPFHSESSIKELAAKIAEIAVETHSSGKDLVLSDIDFNEDERPSPHRRRIEITRQKVMVF